MNKKVIVFLCAVAISLVAASYRWNDAAHSIGLIRAEGGTARHPSTFAAGSDRYMLIATATVLPPYRGDVRVRVEGVPEMPHTLYLSGPVIDLGLSKWPKLDGETIKGLKTKDRIALWVEMRPPAADPVCGMARQDGFATYTYKGKEYAFCNESCLKRFREDPEKYRDADHIKGKYTLAFYDTKTDKPVLRVPLEFKGKGDAGDGAEHHH